MKKHIIPIIIVACILTAIGAGVWFAVNKPYKQSLYSSCTNFSTSVDSKDLTTNIALAQELYSKAGATSDTRVLRLMEIVIKFDTLQDDLNSYLLLSSPKPSSTKKISKAYNKLQSTRATLIKNYNEYNTRMSGNTNMDGSSIKTLYNEIFDKTVNFIYSYNSCFNSVTNYIFSKVYTANTIKREVYLTYSASVSNLLNNISNYTFTTEGLTTITRLNSAIELKDGVLQLRNEVKGGEFSFEARQFKLHFNNSNAIAFANNFETYYKLNINIDTETSAEKLAVHYIKKILEV